MHFMRQLVQIAEICENNGAVGSVIAEDSKQQRKHNLQYTPHVLGIMKSIKKAFDPNNILNPGVIIDLDD